MKLAFYNESRRVSDDDVARVMRACLAQLTRHVAPLWEWLSPTSAGLVASEADARALPLSTELIRVMDDPDAPDALGDHFEEAGRVVGQVFVTPTLDAGGGIFDDNGTGECVSGVASHECDEAGGNPRVNKWVDGPAIPEGSCYAGELSDPVQGNLYQMPDLPDGPVLVSNFVTPAWFDPAATASLDYMEVLSAPFTVGPGGYMLVRSAPGDEREVFGAKPPPEWKMALKRRNRRSRYSRLCGGSLVV